jgi:SOS response regulatory protein OraA/RecX
MTNNPDYKTTKIKSSTSPLQKLADACFPWKKRKVHRQVKDRLFRFLFEKDREALLQLYNALNGTDYQDASLLDVVTIESVVYVVMKNDLAFMIAGVLNLYEHQSTFNPNMPLRFLLYLAQEYQLFVEEMPESLYGTKQIALPTPHCVVFYNGDQEMPEEQILRLSDAFEHQDREPDVELKVRVLNINYGHNTELMKQCKILEEYAKFVAVTKEFTARNSDRQQALNDAIAYCIDHHILEDFLRKYRQEVLGMLLEEFDVKKYERSLREEGIEIGLATGREEGIEIGLTRGLATGRAEGLATGRAEGLASGRETIIHNMLRRGFSDEEICSLVECSQETLDEIRGKKQ